MMQSHIAVYDSYRRKESLGLGVLQIVVGALCIIFNSLAIGFWPFDFGTATLSYGFWGGAVYIVTGAVGVSAAKYATHCKVLTFMVMCVITPCVSIAVFTLAVIAARDSHIFPYGEQCSGMPCTVLNNIGISMNSAIACLSVIATTVAIWCFVNCCMVLGCCTNSNLNFSTVPEKQNIFSLPQQQMLSVPLSQQSYPGQILIAYPQGYPSQQMINIPAPPYQANTNAPSYEVNLTDEKVPIE